MQSRGAPPQQRQAPAPGAPGAPEADFTPPPPPQGEPASQAPSEPDAGFDEGYDSAQADAGFEPDVSGVDEPQGQPDASFGYDEAYGEDRPAAAAPVVAEPREREAGTALSKGRTGKAPALVAGWSALGLFVLAVLGIFLLMPGSVMAALPGSAHLYQAIGMAPAQRADLGFENISYAWTRYQGQKMLQVEGEIVNFTPEQVSLPNVLIALLDEDGEKISEWMAPAGETTVIPGGKSEFATQIPSPPDTVRSFRVRFQKEG